MTLHYNEDESQLYVKKPEICKFKENDNLSWYKFCLATVSKGFRKDELTDISLNVTVNIFSVNHSSVKKRRHLIFKNV